MFFPLFDAAAPAAQTVSPLALLPGAGMLLVGLGFIAYALLRRLGVPYLLLGALAWAITVALKFAWAIPFNGPIYMAVTGALPGIIGLLIVDVYIGALTGVFEVGGTWLGLRLTGWGRTSWPHALAFGIGFGALEAIVVGLSPFATALVALADPSSLPPEMLQSITAAADPLVGLAPIWERFFTIGVHIFSNVLIFYSLTAKGNGGLSPLRALALAFLFKTAIDSFAAHIQIGEVLNVSGNELILRLWLIEAIIGVFGVIGFLGTRWLGARYPDIVAPSGQAGSVPQAEFPVKPTRS